MSGAASIWGAGEAGRRNLALLVQLRWLAVGGQLTTILVVHGLMRVPLPILPMLAILGGLVLLSLAQLGLARRVWVTRRHLLLALTLDVAALGGQLYLSGGVTNPFIDLFLLQVVLGAVLLRGLSWLLVLLSSSAVALLSVFYLPLLLPAPLASRLSAPYVGASWFNFTLTAVLLVMFVTRIARNLRQRDAHLAAARERAAEGEQIVRMGLLASGAAHELGTPLASLSVALGDWSREPAVAGDPRLAEEVAEMRAEVARCKQVLGNILLAAGEVSGEAPARTTLKSFVAQIVERWEASHPGLVAYDERLGADRPVVVDRVLAQAVTNLLDNAEEAGARRIRIEARVERERLLLTVEDDGPGFPAGMLADVGKPYRSTKMRRGAGLGLFLANNVMRTLGGTLTAENRAEGGATVRLALPLAALSA